MDIGCLLMIASNASSHSCSSKCLPASAKNARIAKNSSTLSLDKFLKRLGYCQRGGLFTRSLGNGKTLCRAKTNIDQSIKECCADASMESKAFWWGYIILYIHATTWENLILIYVSPAGGCPNSTGNEQKFTSQLMTPNQMQKLNHH